MSNNNIQSNNQISELISQKPELRDHNRSPPPNTFALPKSSANRLTPYQPKHRAHGPRASGGSIAKKRSTRIVPRPASAANAAPDFTLAAPHRGPTSACGGPGKMVELNGLEPMTSCLQSRRSPN